jgi:hypothetical protein
MRKPGFVLIFVLTIMMLAAMHGMSQAELRFGPWVYYAPYYFPPPEACPECWPVGALGPRYESPPPPPPKRDGEWRQFERQLGSRKDATKSTRKISRAEPRAAPPIGATRPRPLDRTKAKAAPGPNPRPTAGSVYQPQPTRQPGVRPTLAPTAPGVQQSQ